MTRRLAVLLAGVALTSVTAAAAADTPLIGKPVLRVGPLYPLTIHGIGFRARERVTVTVRATTVHTRRVVATRTGTFNVTFPLKLTRCGSVTVRAVGLRGSRAVRQLARPNCRDAGTTPY